MEPYPLKCGAPLETSAKSQVSGGRPLLLSFQYPFPNRASPDSLSSNHTNMQSSHQVNLRRLCSVLSAKWLGGLCGRQPRVIGNNGAPRPTRLFD